MKRPLSFHSNFREENQNYETNKRNDRYNFTPKKESNKNLISKTENKNNYHNNSRIPISNNSSRNS